MQPNFFKYFHKTFSLNELYTDSTYNILTVLDDPAPLRQPVMQMTGSPDLINPFFFPKSTQYCIRSSTSADQSSRRPSKRTR